MAVIAVIADHTLHWPSGGFIGVDVFFVISGFLITGLLLREHWKTGQISFSNFYRRRVRRIIPLALLVILATLIASWLLLNAGRGRAIADDALWSTLFSANWHFAFQGTDYMNAGAAVSPLQHFWSLAVEEQFYVVWPWLLVLVLGTLATRRGWSTAGAARVLGLVMAAITVISFAWSMLETSTNPTVAYFSTFSRAWELGVGALLALAAEPKREIPEAVRALMAYGGLAGIGVSFFLINSSSPFPGPWALLPVCATGLVVFAGGDVEKSYLAPLTNPVARYLGDISYSLYLWHFPVAVIGKELLPDGPLSDAALLAAVLVLSSVSYHLLEDPVRKSRWLEPKALRQNRERLRLSPYPYVGLLLVVTLSLTAGAFWRSATLTHENSAAAVVPVTKLGSPPSSGTKPATATDQEMSKVQQALSAASWPDLIPKIDDLGPDAKAPEWVQDGCLALEKGSHGDSVENTNHCTYGTPGAEKTAVVLGDSVAISYVQGIRAALEPEGYKVLVYTMEQCPAATVTVLRGNGGNQPHPQCDMFRQWTLDKVNALKPDIVITSANRDSFSRLASGAKGVNAVNEWTHGLTKTVSEIAASAKHIFLLDPPPGGKNLQECATKVSHPSNCLTGLDDLFQQMSNADKTVAAAFTSRTKINAVESASWFCSLGNCPPFVGNTPVYADGTHLTAAFSRSLGPVFAQVLVP